MTRLATPIRLVLAATLALLLAACALPGSRDTGPRTPLGDFRLGHNIVTARDPTVGPLSRTATEAEWQSAMQAAIARELGGYNGSGLYHTGISIDGYALAIPGVPVVMNPKSALVISVTVWNNATASKLNKEPKQFTVFETLSAETVISSGLTRSKKQQMADLTANAAAAVHRWLKENGEWFGATADPSN